MTPNHSRDEEDAIEAEMSDKDIGKLTKAADEHRRKEHSVHPYELRELHFIIQIGYGTQPKTVTVTDPDSALELCRRIYRKLLNPECKEITIKVPELW